MACTTSTGAAHLRPLPQASGSHAGPADRLLDSSSSTDASALDSDNDA